MPRVGLAVVLLAACLSAGPAGAGDYQVESHVLDNGLKVLILEKHTTPVVAVNVWYRVGSKDEVAGTMGVAHLLEHMMFRGSENYSMKEASRLAEQVGGDVYGGTTTDFTLYQERFPAGQLELAFKLESDRMCRLKLDSEVFRVELEVVKEEFRMYQNDPMGEVYRRAMEFLYPDHPYEHDVGGTMADLDSLTVDDCRSFYERHYAPNNAVLVVAGDVRADSVLLLAERYFGAAPPKSVPPEPDLTLKPQSGMRRFAEKVSLPVPTTAVAFRVPEERHPDVVALQVANSILAEGRSARLDKSLVREKELAVAMIDLSTLGRGPGYLVYAGVHLPNVPTGKVERAIFDEVNRLKTEGVTERELRAAKKRMLAAKVFGRYSAQGLARGIGEAEVVKGDYRRFQAELDEVMGVTDADIRRVAAAYFTEANATVLAFRPRKANWLAWLYGFFKSSF